MYNLGQVTDLPCASVSSSINGSNIYLLGLLRSLNVLIHIRHIEQCLMYSTYSVNISNYYFLFVTTVASKVCNISWFRGFSTLICIIIAWGALKIHGPGLHWSSSENWSWYFRKVAWVVLLCNQCYSCLMNICWMNVWMNQMGLEQISSGYPFLRNIKTWFCLLQKVVSSWDRLQANNMTMNIVEYTKESQFYSSQHIAILKK